MEDVAYQNNFERPTAFIVEDDRDLNKLICGALNRIGFKTESAFRGSEAVERLDVNSNIIMILDYRLPDMTGKEVIEALQAKQVFVPFVIITGEGGEKTAVDMMKHGARDYIVKDPELIDMLPHAVSRVASELASEKKLIEARNAVTRSRSKLAILYRVSSAISQTIDIDKLLHIVLETITDLEIFKVEKSGGIFLVEDDRMNLLAHLGHHEEFINLHKGLRVGDCLCGLAAESGEIVISQNSNRDIRHTIRYKGMRSHGHIIVPLHARGRVIGVLYLYCSTDIELDKDKIQLLTSIGNQIGIAIENAKLYEETKRVSLHDPLTGLANRRMMDIVLERSFDRSRRFNTPFSAIMLDIDHFKAYNDNLGHEAGDKILVELAGLILKETRKIDLVVRYGGEEFLVLLPDTYLEKAKEVAERMRRSVEETTDITISLGVATVDNRMRNPMELIIRSDEALYDAKRNGRNRLAVGKDTSLR